MAVELTLREKKLFEDARSYALQHIAPHAAEWEKAAKLPLEAVEQAARSGYCGIGLKQKYGGRELNFLDCALIYEGLAHGCGGFAFFIQLHNNITFDIGTYFQISEEVEKLLPDMVSGKKLTAFALTEAGGGTDPSMNKSYAELRDDGYHLFGSKAWIANAVDAEHFVVIVREGDSKNMLIFLVDRGAPGFTVGENILRIGGNVMSCADLQFDDVTVPESRLMSKQGFKEALRSIDVARIYVPAIAIGIAQRSIDLTVDYLAGRNTFGKPILSNQAIQWSLAEMTAQVEAGRWLLYSSASLMDSGGPASVKAAMNKFYATDLAMRVTTECVQLFGARGLVKDSPVAQFMAVAKMLQMVDGTSQVQKIVAGRALERGTR